MDRLTRLRATNAAIRRGDGTLDEELARIAADRAELHPELPEAPPAGREAAARAPRAPEPPPDDFQVETIVMRTGRPVLAIRHDEADLTFADADSEVWRSRLVAARPHLVHAAKAVGRIEVEGHQLAWLGTGWLVAPEIVVTNRHVAGEFGRRTGARFRFRQGLDGRPMQASIDFLEELDRTESRSFVLREILHIEDDGGPDVAFLRVEQVDGDEAAEPVVLADAAHDDEFVAVIGYPARDSRIPDADLMDRIFGDVYDRKRLAPGMIRPSAGSSVQHDCSTLGGNSGSVVLSLDTGAAVGLHFAGRFLESNYAVPSAAVARRLDEVQRGVTAPHRPAEPREHTLTASLPAAAAGATSAEVTFEVPVSVTVRIGDPHPARSGGLPVGTGAIGAGEDDVDVLAEAVPEDYADRAGYDPSFLGEGLAVPLPELTDHADDVVSFEFDGTERHVLDYEHFSVVMSAARRMCRFSAVNVDGLHEKRFARVGWRIDPRIPRDAQISKECYGNAPKFSRGHMTRREDPVWGSDDDAARGNSDSMHVTNAVPQMQPFNAGVWLDLEDYALQNARRDDMRITVFTGPFLEDDDPVRFGVRVPVEFWKVIAFVHDETGELCATGYTMSQRAFLSEEEFVFGAHETAQGSIAAIESRAGLSFGPLAALDPFEEPEGAIAPLLTDVRQIRFVRSR
ncbi:hypothetical protein GCM10009819_09060 [Agromyces tropicus]|uniref:Serine protease n=1 Tax=Agromyces tropicus TaxID=555371 RepID=A0ABN2U388_9MICO